MTHPRDRMIKLLWYDAKEIPAMMADDVPAKCKCGRNVKGQLRTEAGVVDGEYCYYCANKRTTQVTRKHHEASS